jgi:hypothetical protein
MGTPRRVWFSGEAGQLRCEVNRLMLSVELSTTVGFIVFTVRTQSAASSGVLVSGIERSALCAMQAAEEAAALLAPWPGAGIVGDDDDLPPPVSAQAKRARVALGHGGANGIALARAGITRTVPVLRAMRARTALPSPDRTRLDATSRPWASRTVGGSSSRSQSD